MLVCQLGYDKDELKCTSYLYTFYVYQFDGICLHILNERYSEMENVRVYVYLFKVETK